jgi:hypothetical protein
VRPLGRDDILSPEAFEAVRPRWREAVMAHKAARRLAVGDRVTLLFEDRETVRWQVQEMCRVEGLREPEAVQHELDVYNELVPGERELSATLFVEIVERSRIREELDRLVGIDEHVTLWIGEEAIPARFDPKQMEEERISAVQYVRFALPPEQVLRFGDPALRLRVRIDHPAYRAEAELPPALRRALEVDLSGEPAPLVDPAALRAPAAPAGAAREAAVEPLRARGRARALRVAGPDGPGAVVVEALEAVSFTDAPAALLADVMGLAQEIARELGAAGGCVLRVDAAAVPLRVHLRPRSAR